MTNPFIIGQQQEEDDNPFVVRQRGFSSYTPEQPDFLSNMLSRIQQTARVLQLANPISGLPNPTFGLGDEQRRELYERMLGNTATFKPAAIEAINGMGRNISSLFDRDSYENLRKKVSGFVDKLVDDPIGTTTNSAASLATGVASLPVALVSSFVVDPFEAMTGIDTSSPELKSLAVDERAQRMKMTAANAVSLAVGIGTSKAVGTAFTIRQKALLGGPATKEALERASIGTLSKVSSMGDSFGTIGQSMIDDVVGSVVGGGIQGALSSQDPNDTLSNLATGILFAPLGAATGYIRGRRANARGLITERQRIATDAHDVAMLRQVRYAESKSIRELENNANAIIKSSSIVEAVINGRVRTKPNAIGVIPNVDRADIINTGNTGINIYQHKKPDGTVDVLFTGPARQLRGYEVEYFQHHGTLPATAKFIQDVNYQGQTFQVVGKNGDNVTLRHSVSGQEVTTKASHVSIEDVELKPFTEQHFIDKLWNDFNKAYDPTKPFNVQLANFNSLKGLGNDIRPLANAFTQKLHKIGVDALDPEEQLIFKQRQKDLTETIKQQELDSAAKTHADATELVMEAESRGYYIEDDGGVLTVRTIEGDDVIGRFASTEEALAFARASGAAIEAKSLDIDSPIPSDVGGVMAPVTPAKSHLSAPWKPRDPRRFERWVNQFDARHPNWASAEQYFVGIDGTEGTRTKLEFMRTQDAARKTNSRIEVARTSPKVQLLKKTLDKLTPKQREQVSLLQETSSWDELVAPGGIARHYDVSEGSIKVAKWFHENNQDYNKALRWLRERFALNMRYQNQYEAAARQQEASMLMPGLADEEVIKLRKSIMDRQSQWSFDPEYRLELDQLKQRFGVDAKFEEGANFIDGLFQSPTGSMDVYAGSRLYRALVEPDLSGLNKKDFVEKHKLTPTQVQAQELLAELYDNYAAEFGVKDGRFITNFLNHYRIYGDPMDLTGLDYYTRGILDGNKRRFASDMVRTGEIANYERDPMRAFDNYLRAGIKSQYLYPALDAADEVLKSELKKIAAQDTREQLTRRWVEYTSALTGALNMDQRAAAAIMMKHLKNLGLDDAQVITKMNESPVLNTVLNWVNSSTMGGRAMMALRDTNDAITKYVTLHGVKRTKDFLKKAVTAEQLQRLKEFGVVKSTSFEEMYDPGSLQPTPQNRVGSIAHKAAEVGFKLSGQGVVYERVQAAAYLENRSFIGDVLKKFFRNEITKEAAYEKIFLNKHDAVVASKFDELVSSGKHEQATHFLAQEEAHLVSGLFGLGNQPQGARTTFGRLYGQLGSYSIANRSFYWKIGFKGTPKEIARTLTRYSMSQSALLLTGHAMGLNLSRWMVTPLSFIFTGGPMLNVAENLVSAGQSIAGSESQQDYAFRQVKRQGWLAVPFGYAIRDVYRAWEMFDTQPNANPFHVGSQALGIPPLER